MLSALVDAYGAAWLEPDADARLAALLLRGFDVLPATEQGQISRVTAFYLSGARHA